MQPFGQPCVVNNGKMDLEQEKEQVPEGRHALFSKVG